MDRLCSCTCIDSWAGEHCDEAPSNLPCGGGGDCAPDLCATNNGGCDALTSCSLAFGGRQCGECPYPMYRTTFSGDGASICVDVDECDTKPCWQARLPLQELEPTQLTNVTIMVFRCV